MLRVAGDGPLQGREAIALAFEASADTIEHAGFAAKPHPRVDEDLAREIARSGVPVAPTTNNCWLAKGVPWASIDIALRNLKILHECGITLVAGTDMGLPSTTPEKYADGLEVMAVAGIPLADVLAAATTSAALALGEGSRLGRIAPGYAADLVALDGDRLSHVRRTAG